MNRTTKISLAVVIGLVTASIGWFAFKKTTPQNDNVVIRELESTAPTQWELAKKLTGRDILEEESVKLELIRSVQSSGGTTSLQALLANNIDVCSESAWPAWINVIARGGKIKALLDICVTTKDNEGGQQGMLVLDDSSIHSIKDLPGKRIAVNVLGAESDYVIRHFLKKMDFQFHRWSWLLCHLNSRSRCFAVIRLMLLASAELLLT